MRLQEQLAAMQERMFGASSGGVRPPSPRRPRRRNRSAATVPSEQPALPVIETRHELPPSERTAIPASPSVKPTSSGVRAVGGDRDANPSFGRSALGIKIGGSIRNGVEPGVVCVS